MLYEPLLLIVEHVGISSESLESFMPLEKEPTKK